MDLQGTGCELDSAGLGYGILCMQ